MTGYDQQNQNVNEQININIQRTPSADANALLTKGVQLLEAKSYKQAIIFLRAAIQGDPLLANAYYCLAIALLKGKRPKVLQRRQVEEIDQLLTTAIAVGDSDGTVKWFQVLLRHDYYIENRMKCPSPSVQEIITSINPGTINISRLKKLLIQLPMTNNQLYNQLFNQIF